MHPKKKLSEEIPQDTDKEMSFLQAKWILTLQKMPADPDHKSAAPGYSLICSSGLIGWLCDTDNGEVAHNVITPRN